ncbi:MAG: TonB-dependent receptor [Silvibacterium sp.]
MNRVGYSLSRVFVVALITLLFVAIAGAQENAGISGVVTDQSGAAVPGATVTVTHGATGTVHSTLSDSNGLFNFSELQIGTYDLKVAASGFKTYTQAGLVLNEAQTLRANAKLEVGAASQTITVRANALQTQAETSEVSSLISGQQVLQLATNGRNVMSLTTLGTGVTNTLPSFNGVTAQGSSAEINFNGSRYDHNNWMVDGGEIYDRGSGGKLGVAVSPDALAEFQVLSSNYQPDYGIASGGTVLMVLKSGSRNFHGGLWEFNRNDAFDAGYYFYNKEHLASPELRLNIFGGNIGGPVWIPHVYNNDRNKTFFFVNEEWRKFIQGANASVTNTIPAADFPVSGQNLQYTPLSGSALTVPNTSDPAKLALYSQDGLVAGQPFTQSSPGVYTIPANLIDPNAVLFMGTGAIPKPNTANGTQYIASPKQPTYVREDVVRIDHHLSDKYTLMGHWIHDQMSQTIYPDMWSNNSYVTTGDVFANPSWGTVVKLTQTLSPTVLNETGLYVNGNTIDITPAGIYAQPSGWSAAGIFSGNNALNRLPSIDFQGAPNTNWTINYWPWHNSYLNYQIRDDLSWTKGLHSLKFGFGYMRSDKNQQQQADTQGDYTFNGSSYAQDAYANFLLGFASSYQQLQTLATDHWVNNTYSAYANDNWHVLPRLTLNLGIRYDALPHVYEKNNRTSNFIPADFNAADEQIPNASGALDPTGPGFSQPAGAPVPFYLNGVQLAGVNGLPRGLVKNSWGTVQPRVGFADDLFGDGKTVLRGGFGMFFERIQGNDIYGTDTNPPYAYQPSVSAVYFSNPNTSNQTGQTAAAPFFPSNFTNLAYYYPHPGTAQFSLGVQHQVAPSVIAAIQYVGMTAWHQNDERAINTLPLSDVTDRQAVATHGANSNLYRIYPGFGGITQIENITNSSYHSLQAALRMENRHGLTFELAYTWSHEIDIQSGDLTSTNQQGSGGQISDPFNIEYDRGSGTIDRRNVFSANYIYNLPFFLHSSNGFTRSALGGWQISGITVAQSGNPVNATYSPDTLGLGGGTTNRPDKVSGVSYPKNQLAWFNPAAFAAPVAPWNGGGGEGFGNAGKDTIVGPGLFNWNLSLFKEFQLTSHEGPRIQLRAESYNTFNHTEWNNIDTGFTDSNFGQITSTYDPRTWQFGGKFLF